MSEIDIVIFMLVGEAYCVPVNKVQEIQSYHSHPVPRVVPDSSDLFEGIINLRDQVIPVLDLKQRFGLGQVEPSRKTCYIIVDTENDNVGLLVDSVLEVKKVNQENFSPPPARMKLKATRDCVLGVGKIIKYPATDTQAEESYLAVLLDVERLITQPMA